MWSTCNLPCNYLSSLLSECQRLLREMKEVETYLFQLGCPKADKWLTEEKFLKVISSYTQDLKNARSSVTEKILEHIYYTCHFNWKGILTQAFYLFSQLRENFERVRWILALYHPSTPLQNRHSQKPVQSQQGPLVFLLLLCQRSSRLLHFKGRKHNLK